MNIRQQTIDLIKSKNEQIRILKEISNLDFKTIQILNQEAEGWVKYSRSLKAKIFVLGLLVLIESITIIILCLQ